MDVKIEGDFSQIPIGFVENPADMQPGWYYTLPIPEDMRAHPNEIALAGPFDSKFAAALAAISFINDALVDHNAEVSALGPKQELAVFTNPDPNFVPRSADDDMA
jgi:hypothetical protein